MVDEFVDEGIPENEPRFDDEEADIQRAMKESLKDVHAAPRGLLPPVVFREPDSRRRQPLPEVEGKGKEKVIEEQATLADVETDTEELLISTENSGEEVSNIVVLGTKSGGQDDKQGGPDPSDSAESKLLASIY
ncbi:retrovirus-related pol polyprotein from transposon TNT 1-94 [Tanacetum coccineum]